MNKQISLSIIICVAMIFGSCKKEGPNIFNMFTDVKVEFHNNDPQDIVDYKVVKVGDDVWIDYTVTSAKEDMYTINLLEVGTASPTKYPLDASQRRVASGVIKLKATARTGQISYRLYPTDKTGIYLGDGYKTLTIEVVNDFNFITERFVSLPDTSYKVIVNPIDLPASTVTYPDGNPNVPSFYSTAEAKAYNFADAAANSAKIDFGIYMKIILTWIPDTKFPTDHSKGSLKIEPHYYLYVPGVVPLPFSNFNFSGWTAAGTLFSDKQSGLTTFTAFKTGLQIGDAAKKLPVNLTNVELIVGDTYYFLTKEGKYGAIAVTSIGSDRNHPLIYMDLSEKIQL